MRLDRAVDIAWELWDLLHLHDDLFAAIPAARELSTVADDPAPGVRGMRLEQLGTSLMIRYTRTGELAALHEAIGALEGGARDLSQSDARYLECVSTLSTALVARHAQTGDASDIERAVALAIRAVTLASQISEARLDEYCLRAGAALADRYEYSGDDQSLTDSIAYFRDALAATERQGGEVSGRCADLARALLMKYRRWAQAADLDEAGLLYRRAIDELPVGHHEIASHTSGLGGVLSIRYEHYGDSADLTPAVDLLSDAYDLTSADDAAKPVRLGRLADALLVRFGHYRDEADLDRAVALLELGLATSTLNPPLLTSFQVGLAGALRTRGLHRGDLADLRHSEQLLLDVSAQSDRTARRDASLTFNLASVRQDIYSFTRESAHLASAITGMREAVAASPSDSPSRSHAKTFLANLLITQAEDEGAGGDSPLLTECLRLSREAALDPILVPALGFMAAVTWAELADGIDRLNAYERALELIRSVSSHGLTVTDSLSRLRDLPSIASDACAEFIAVGRFDRAIEVLEEGRAMSVRLRIRWRADVEDLRAVRADLADAYSNLLEASNSVTSGLDVDPRGESRQIEELLEEIRGIDGFTTFGLPRTSSEVRALAGDATVVYINVATLRCDALLVTTAGITVVPLKVTAPEIARRAVEFWEAVNTSTASSNMSEVIRSERFAQGVAAWLWDSIAGPVLEHLEFHPRDDATDPTLWPRIWWIPTGHLVMLPMQIAGHHSAYGTKTTDSSRTAIDRVVSTQLPSIEALAAARRVPDDQADNIRCLIVATSDADGETALSGVSREVSLLVKQLKRDRVMLLADEPALIPDGPSTKPAVLDALPRSNWAHFACHAMTTPHAPTESQLILSDYRTDPFRVEDLLLVRPDAPRLAFFSACSTAYVSPDLAHEPIHFGMAASLAGYAHSVLTLWPVRDDPEIADLVYQGVLRAVTWPMDAATAASVHDANRKMRVRSANALHRWAATIHQGP